MFPYLRIWGMYGGHTMAPWFGRAYTLALEPWSSLPGDFSMAKEGGETLHIGSNGSKQTKLCFAFYSL